MGHQGVPMGHQGVPMGHQGVPMGHQAGSPHEYCGVLSRGWRERTPAEGGKPTMPLSRDQNANASAGNRTRVTSMATMYSTTRPLML